MTPLERDLVIRAAAAVRRGEWTSYGEIARAAGLLNGARQVGRLAARDPEFPNAQRVLRSGGWVSPDWRSATGGPEECARRLAAEGVAMRDGRADPTAHVGVAELVSRLGAPTRTAGRRAGPAAPPAAPGGSRRRG